MMARRMLKVTATLQRFEPERGHSYQQDFTVDLPAHDHVLNLLAAIRREHDPALSYPSHFCKVGTCGACTLMVDGKSALGCRALVTGERISIAPAKGRDVLADLLTSDKQEGEQE